MGKTSHKDVKDSTNWLFRAYYGNRMFMAYCCVSCEVIVDFHFFFHFQCHQYLSVDPLFYDLAGSLHNPISYCEEPE